MKDKNWREKLPLDKRVKDLEWRVGMREGIDILLCIAVAMLAFFK